jgi:PAT family acetyl-CoA transporter-like MFS transporter 1
MLDTVNVGLITSVFFMLNFLAATQDIAVDGWALTMLRRENVGYASTCNSVGQTAGYFLGYVVFLALESADFCNNYLRSVPEKTGLVTLPGFLYFWAWVFMITTTAVWILKKEKREKGVDTEYLDIASSYLGLWNILKLPSIKKLIVFFLTCKIGFAAADSVTGLKLVEAGVPKDRLALLAIPLTPLQIVLPFIIAKYTAGPNAMDFYVKVIPIRLLFGFVFAAIVWLTPTFKLVDGSFPFYYYASIVFIYAFHQITVYTMYVAAMAFSARIADPAVGGTYMTLLNTVSNLGGNWPSTLALWLVDPLTTKNCVGGNSTSVNDCSDSKLSELCTTNGGTCSTIRDGYYVEIFVCVLIGFAWYSWGRPTILRLQQLADSSWKVMINTNSRND